jgi:hypothetical protein
MQNHPMNVMYESYSEKELIKMWEEIKGGNIEGLNHGLMKAIAKNEEVTHARIGEEEDPLYTKRMWDSEKDRGKGQAKGGWVPFCIWGAHFIVNERKETVIVQIWRPCDIQPEYGPILKAWHSLDSSYLNEQLKEKGREANEKFEKMYTGIQAFREMVRQDQQELYRQGRYEEMNGYQRPRRV